MRATLLFNRMKASIAITLPKGDTSGYFFYTYFFKKTASNYLNEVSKESIILLKMFWEKSRNQEKVHKTIKLKCLPDDKN